MRIAAHILRVDWYAYSSVKCEEPLEADIVSSKSPCKAVNDMGNQEVPSRLGYLEWNSNDKKHTVYFYIFPSDLLESLRQ